MTSAISLIGGRILHPSGEIETGDLHIADGLIVETPAAEAARIDCRGHHVLPGIVDLHGDAFETALFPRPGVEIAFPIAMGWVDRQLLASGITTACHGLSVSWEPGARSIAAARRFMTGLRRADLRLIADHRVQLRWEVFAHDVIPDLLEWLGETPRSAIAFNDHTTETLERLRAGDDRSLAKWADRAGVSFAEYTADIDRLAARAPDVPARIAEVAGRARAKGAVLLAHDEATEAEREANRALGMTVSEFPLTARVAARAVHQGEHVVLGGPNLLRGQSHKGNLSAAEALADGLCTILASDYYYPSLLHSAEHLVRDRGMPLAEAWKLISRNPAEALRLTDRGDLSAGSRADIAILDCDGPWRLVHTIAQGRAFRFGG